MFKELDVVVLTAQIPLENTWSVPKGSPLRRAGNRISKLVPGDTGTVVYAQGKGEAFEVEFLEPDGRTVAVATIQPSEARLATPDDIANYRFFSVSHAAGRS